MTFSPHGGRYFGQLRGGAKDAVPLGGAGDGFPARGNPGQPRAGLERSGISTEEKHTAQGPKDPAPYFFTQNRAWNCPGGSLKQHSDKSPERDHPTSTFLLNA